MNTCQWHLCQKEAKEKFCSKKCASKFYVDKRRKKLKQMAVDYMGSKCWICGYDKTVWALHFHHLDPNKKDFHISKNGHTRSWDQITQEIEKCVLLCSNCHAEVHAGCSDFCPNTYRDSFQIDLVRFNQLWPNPKNIKSKKIKSFCLDCNIEITNNATKCLSCYRATKKTKIKWPNSKKLLQMVQESNYTQVAKQLGVSDNAVRKRLKKWLPR